MSMEWLRSRTFGQGSFWGAGFCSVVYATTNPLHQVVKLGGGSSTICAFGRFYSLFLRDNWPSIHFIPSFWIVMSESWMERMAAKLLLWRTPNTVFFDDFDWGTCSFFVY